MGALRACIPCMKHLMREASWRSSSRGLGTPSVRAACSPGGNAHATTAYARSASALKPSKSASARGDPRPPTSLGSRACAGAHGLGQTTQGSTR